MDAYVLRRKSDKKYYKYDGRKTIRVFNFAQANYNVNRLKSKGIDCEVIPLEKAREELLDADNATKS